jgi:hypothetical protein
MLDSAPEQHGDYLHAAGWIAVQLDWEAATELADQLGAWADTAEGAPDAEVDPLQLDWA